MKKNIDLIKLKNKIEKYEYISFDIFDTLIKRNIDNPTKVAMMLEKKNNIAGFSKERIDSEINCWKNKKDKEFYFPCLLFNKIF